MVEDLARNEERPDSERPDHCTFPLAGLWGFLIRYVSPVAILVIIVSSFL